MTNEAGLAYEQYMKALGARIKQIRKARGLSLRDMVVKHDYHDSQWRRFERSGTGSVSSLLKIAKAFNISISILLDGLGEYSTASVAQLKNKEEALQDGGSEVNETSALQQEGALDRRKSPDRRTNPDRRTR